MVFKGFFNAGRFKICSFGSSVRVCKAAKASLMSASRPLSACGAPKVLRAFLPQGALVWFSIRFSMVSLGFGVFCGFSIDFL